MKGPIMDLKNFFRAAVVAATTATLSLSAQAADITGAGATFPFPVYSNWADAYKTQTGTGLNYQSIGSGAGVKQIQARTVTFGATDAPLQAPQLEKDGLVQWPMVMGAIVLVVNVDGLKHLEDILLLHGLSEEFVVAIEDLLLGQLTIAIFVDGLENYGCC
jgi:phosphate transport system substrate-binding protein